MVDKFGNKKRAKHIQIKRPALNESGDIKPTSSVDAPRIDYPVFCFRHLVRGYAICDCDKEQKAHLIDKLSVMTQKTWQDLNFGYNKKGAGFEKIPVNQFLAQIPKIVTDDVSKLWVIRFNNMNHRIIGLRKENIYHITHIDVDLTAYKH